MLDNVLIPTDGTEVSAQAAAFGVQLAKKMGARVTVVTVTTPADAIMVGEVRVIRNSEEYEEKASASARVMLDAVGKLAIDSGVACEKVHARSELPWHGILETAKSTHADMIVMASHGRRGLSAMLIGSETQKVINHSHIPVTIYRKG
jgi:nucleotide-binding universal stress UspA family protein